MLRLHVNDHALAVPDGTTLEDLADKLWIGASLEVEHFVVDGAFIDRSAWSHHVLRDEAEIVAWRVGAGLTQGAQDD